MQCRLLASYCCQLAREIKDAMSAIMAAALGAFNSIALTSPSVAGCRQFIDGACCQLHGDTDTEVTVSFHRLDCATAPWLAAGNSSMELAASPMAILVKQRRRRRCSTPGVGFWPSESKLAN